MLIRANIFNKEFKFYTDARVFSPKKIDYGTMAMLNTAYSDGISTQSKALDLGCGYGVVGIALASLMPSENVYLSDSDAHAIELAIKNTALNCAEGVNVIKSDAFSNITEKDFTLILSNPPYHTDFSVPKLFVEKGFNRLAIGGRMYVVVKRLVWYKNKLLAIFGGVRVTVHGDYYVLMAEKRKLDYANTQTKKQSKNNNVSG